MTRIASFAALTFCLLLPVSPGWAEEARVLFQRETPYNNVIVTQTGNERVLQFRRRRVDYSETTIDVTNPLRLVSEHTRLMMAGLLFVPQPRRVLMIGLGGGIVTRVMAQAYPECVFDNVELDQVVAEVAERYFGFPPGERQRVFVRDGRVFLRQSQERYDLIILDAFRGGYIPFHLKTKEFLELARAHLTPQGVVVGNLHGGTRLYDSDRATYAAVFPQNYAFVGQQDGNVIVVAQQQTARLSREQLLQRAQQLQQQHRFGFDLPAQLRFLREETSRRPSAPVLTDDHAPVEALDEQRP